MLMTIVTRHDGLSSCIENTRHRLHREENMRCLFGLTMVLYFLFSIGVATAHAADPVSVFVSIVPQKYFVQQIGKDRVDVRVMVQPGASPAMYEPKPQQMVDLSNADVYFAVGVPFERAWLEKIAAANPAMTVIHTDQGIEKRAMTAHHHDDDVGEQHDDGDDHGNDDHQGEGRDEGDHHDHGVLDPHIWLSPPLVKIQAGTILEALKGVDPEHEHLYEANFEEFSSQIDQLNDELKRIFTGKEGLRFMVFHPAWGYFAHAYGLKQVPIEIEGKDPKPAQLQTLIKQARASGINVIFVQPQFSTKSAELVAREIGGQVVPADPLAEDWMANLRAVAAKFDAALK
jgi:zinc transport system substrate-binding protein